MRKLRVGLFTYGMSQNLTGIGRYALELSSALRRLDLPIEMVLLSPYPKSSLEWYQDFPTHWLPNLGRLPGVLLRGRRDLSNAARHLGLDVLHDPCGIAPFRAQPEPFARVVTIHDAIPVVHPRYQPVLTKIVYRTLMAEVPKAADAVIAVSRSAAEDVVRHMGIPERMVHAIPNGVIPPTRPQITGWQSELAAVRAELGITGPYFLFVGADNPRKNVAGVIEAFGRFRSQCPGANLLLVGPPAKALRRTGPGVRHLGYVDQHLLDVLYVGASALVFPSFYEGFGFPVLEAMGHGTPVITSNLSALPEVAGKAAILVDPADVQAIARAMQDCLDPAVADELAIRGRLQARLFDWETAAQRTWDVYQRAASHRRMRGWQSRDVGSDKDTNDRKVRAL